MHKKDVSLTFDLHRAGRRTIALEQDTWDKARQFADALVDVISSPALDGIVRLAPAPALFRKMGVGCGCRVEGGSRGSSRSRRWTRIGRFGRSGSGGR